MHPSSWEFLCCFKKKNREMIIPTDQNLIRIKMKANKEEGRDPCKIGPNEKKSILLIVEILTLM